MSAILSAKLETNCSVFTSAIVLNSWTHSSECGTAVCFVGGTRKKEDKLASKRQQHMSGPHDLAPRLSSL